MTDVATSLRTHLAGALDPAHVGQTVRLGGWVHRRRDLGGILFLDLRDRGGLVQLAFDPRWTPAAALAAAAAAGPESVILVEGEVARRRDIGRDVTMASREVEVQVTGFELVGPAVTPALPVARTPGEELPAEELRLRHRVLDLRRPELQRNLVLRHRLAQATRRYLGDHGFLELETPILTRPTPEGARDYLVPSRVHPGEFYALPQSPQLYKQLFMVAGFDRYYQIARCFRDEDLRADRQPEFTQIDVEASFVGREDVLRLMEGLVAALWAEAGHAVPLPLPRMTWADAMERFGCDRPDLRYELELEDHSDLFRASEFGVTRTALEAGGRVRGLRVPGGAGWSRKQVDELEALARGAGAGGLLRIKRGPGGLEGPVAKHVPAAAAEALGLAEGDLGLYVAAADHVSNPALDRVRQACAERLGLTRTEVQAFTWIVDFPLFERHPATGALASVNHPFTAPHPDDLARLGDAPETVRALAYDVVYNGHEIGGGSMRIVDPGLQERVFGLLGLDPGTAARRFGFLLEALRAGAPPHGGIAFGLDRITMLLAGAGSLRDVIAFPKTTAARALFEGAPAEVDAGDLADLHLRVEA